MPVPKAQVLLASPEAIEQQFYEALQQGDLGRLMQVWADEEEISCVHPGGPRVVGAGAIRTTFEAVFSHGAIAVQVERVRRFQSGDTAIHQVLERVLVNSNEGQQSAWVISTNVYLKTAQGWRMMVHHASPGTPHDVQGLAADLPTTLH